MNARTPTAVLDLASEQETEVVSRSSGSDLTERALRASPLLEPRAIDGSAQPLGLVERLRNGGQPDLADMAQALLDGLEDLLDTGYTGGPQGKRARAAFAKAKGEAL